MIRSTQRPALPWPLCGLALAFAFVLPATAQVSQKIYRCGPDGRQLQQQPCGSTLPPGAGAAEPSEADRAAAAARAQKDAQLAERMQREREKRERDEAKNAAPAVGIGAAPQPKAGKATPKKKGAPPAGDFVAVSPPAPKAKR